MRVFVSHGAVPGSTGVNAISDSVLPTGAGWKSSFSSSPQTILMQSPVWEALAKQVGFQLWAALLISHGINLVILTRIKKKLTAYERRYKSASYIGRVYTEKLVSVVNTGPLCEMCGASRPSWVIIKSTWKPLVSRSCWLPAPSKLYLSIKFIHQTDICCSSTADTSERKHAFLCSLLPWSL